MKKKWIALFALILPFFAIGEVKAQEYDQAITLNLGADMGVGYKKFISAKGAIEGLVAYNIPDDGFMVSAVYQHHIPLTDGFYFYAGGGMNIGGLHLDSGSDSKFAIGITPNVGFEYKFAGAPIALAIDYKPNINFSCHSQWELASFKIRYTF